MRSAGFWQFMRQKLLQLLKGGVGKWNESLNSLDFFELYARRRRLFNNCTLYLEPQNYRPESKKIEFPHDKSEGN